LSVAARDDLVAEVKALGPWHHVVEVVPGLTTAVSREVEYPDEYGEVVLTDYRTEFHNLIGSIYPNLEGRSFLDCACNCGGYLYWAKELGAERAFGFDVREHWIRQAQFLAKHRPEEVEAVACDLYDVPALGLPPFDVVQFKGLFYHLPDPVAGLRIAADLTKELLIVNTATMPGGPGRLVLADEGTELMSGVYELCWYPTGPAVLDHILRWMGFVETMVNWEIPGRIEMLASKVEGLLPLTSGRRGSP
jgi:SAM-dependent methyltransferase